MNVTSLKCVVVLGCLVGELQARDMLPCVLFDLSRERCDQLALAITATIQYSLLSNERHKLAVENTIQVLSQTGSPF